MRRAIAPARWAVKAVLFVIVGACIGCGALIGIALIAGVDSAIGGSPSVH